MAKINVRLKNRNLNTMAFGFKFNEDGICNGEKADFQSHIDAKNFFIVKDLKANKAELNSLAGIDEDEDEL